MYKKPLVSVIVPIYNSEIYIDQCLESICNQSYNNIEILLMVGICRDKSLDKCIEWQKRDDRIIIVSRRDTSLGDARNYALNISKGEFIAYVDADDWIDKEFIYKMTLPLIQDNELKISCCGFFKTSTKGIISQWVPSNEGEIETNFSNYIKEVSFGTVWLKVYRKSWVLQKKLQMFDGCHEDDAYHICLASVLDKIFLIKEPLYYYRVDNTHSLMADIKNRLDYFKAIEYAIIYMKEHDVFSVNYSYLRKQVIEVVKKMLNTYYQYDEFIESSKIFFEKNFNDVYLDYERVKRFKLRKDEKIILWGAGKRLLNALKVIDETKITFIVDNDVQKQGKFVNDKEIVSVSEMLTRYQGELILITSEEYYYDIIPVLQRIELKNYLEIGEYKIKNTFNSKRKSQRFILFNTPVHANVGDHAIADTIKKYIKKEVSNDADIIEINEEEYKKYRFVIKNEIKKEDTILITGGGFLGTLWSENGEYNVRRIISDYPYNKIVVMPQTLYYEDSQLGREEIEKAKPIYNKHKKLTIFLREQYSYDRALKIISDKSVIKLTPDIVLWNDEIYNQNDRNDIAICFKHNKESLVSYESVNSILKMKVLKSYKIDEISMYAECDNIYKNERGKYINNKLQQIGRYRLVITDALHCMIFCALTGTPCVVFNNVSSKCKGTIKWLEHLDYIKFVDDMKTLDENDLVELLKKKNTNYTFNRSLFDSIKDDLVK